jgi:hypothetical protein
VTVSFSRKTLLHAVRVFSLYYCTGDFLEINDSDGNTVKDKHTKNILNLPVALFPSDTPKYVFRS